MKLRQDAAAIAGLGPSKNDMRVLRMAGVAAASLWVAGAALCLGEFFEVPALASLGRSLSSATPDRAVWFVGLAATHVGLLVAALVWVGSSRHRSEVRRRIIESEVNKQREYAEQTLESLGAAIVATDLEGRVVSMNPTAEQLTGWRLPEAVRRPVDDIFRVVERDTGQAVAAPIERVVHEGRPIDLSARAALRSRDGGQLPIAEIASPIADADGTIRGVSLVFRDVESERRAAMERDRASLQLQRAIEASPTGMIIVDEGGRIVFANAEVERLFGYTRSELLGQSVDVLLPERLRDAHCRHRASFLSNPASRQMGAGRDLFGRKRDGSEFSVEVGLNPLETSEGPLVLCSVVDITERLRATMLLRSFVEASPVAEVMTDPAGKIVVVNAQAEALFGYGRAELIGQPVEILVPERLRNRHATLRAAFQSAPGSRRAMGSGRDLFGRRRDGSEVPLDIGLSLVGVDGATYTMASMVDVSARRKAEREGEAALSQLRLLNAELEERVGARTSLLTSTLREREVLLQEVHHRVKNNLQVISSLISLQMRKVKPGESRDVLAECRARVQAIALIHETLYQSRNYAQVSFSDYARTLATNVFNAANRSAGEVALELAADDVALAVDKAIPCGLLLNELITNALKHAFPEDRSGKVRVELRKAGDRDVCLSVSDDGVGMPFPMRGAASSSLGMQLITTLATQLEGQIDVDRTSGTTVRITFPIATSNPLMTTQSLEAR